MDKVPPKEPDAAHPVISRSGKFKGDFFSIEPSP